MSQPDLPKLREAKRENVMQPDHNPTMMTVELPNLILNPGTGL